MGQRSPGGFIGLAIMTILWVIGLVFNVEWMYLIGGGCTMIWLVMFVVGFLAGARG